MIPRLFGIKDAVSVNYFEWYLRQVWPRWLLILLLAVAVAYVVVLYSRERTLGVVRRWVLGALRLTVCCTLLVMLFQPGFSAEITRRIQGNVLVLVDRSQSMTIQDKRTLPPQQAEAALALGKIRYDQADTAVLEPYRADIDRATRLDMAKGILGQPEVRPFEKIGQDHPIRYFAFGQRLNPVSGEGELSADSLKGIAATDKSTSLGSAIEEAVSRYSGQPISAVVLLTDGGSNEGVDPLDVARRMKSQSIQIFPIGIGLSDPPDVAVKDVVVQDTVFSQEKVPVRVQIQSNGFNHQPAQLVLSLDGKEIDHKAITLTGGVQFEEFMFTPERKSGDVKLVAAVKPLPEETVTSNNAIQKNVKVIDEKIKVLYVEGKPRWEYRYLRAVLLRDRRLDVKFLMTQGS
ncbi:MAG: VWA domain-containing protein [Tepidisphaerales bacterium]